MVDMTVDRPDVPRNKLLYDPDLLADIADEFGNAIEIKQGVLTSAKIYEIRTAVAYWFGGENNHRTSDAIWQRCDAIDAGEWVLVGTEIKDAAKVDL